MQRIQVHPPPQQVGRDDGAAALLLVGTAAVVLMVGLAVVAAGQYLAGYLQASAAADAAALAAAPVTFRPYGADGSPAAEAARFARANGTRLVWCQCDLDPSFAPRRVEVRVQRSVQLILFGAQSVAATGRAEFDPTKLVVPDGVARGAGKADLPQAKS